MTIVERITLVQKVVQGLFGSVKKVMDGFIAKVVTFVMIVDT